MNARQSWCLKLVLVVLVIGGLIGAWKAYQGIGSFAPQAQADSKRGNSKDFDHLACYEVFENGEFEELEVRLFNQFEDKKDGVVVRIGALRYLCVPTKKVHLKPTPTVTVTPTGP